MAWIFLAGSVELRWPWSPGCELLPIAKKIDTPKQCYSPEWQKENCRPLQSGTKCKPCQRVFFHLSTSSLEDSPARTLVLQELEKAWQESEAACFLKLSDWLASYDQDSFSWKMCQLSLFEGLTEFCWSSLRWGMIVDGRLYQPQRLEPVILEKDGSYLDTPTASTASYRNQNIPTPTASRVGHNKSASKGAHIRLSLYGMATRGILPGHPKGSLNPEWVEQAMGFKEEWTEINVLGMQWFQSKRARRSKY